jgi:hypothetical protein
MKHFSPQFINDLHNSFAIKWIQPVGGKRKNTEVKIYGFARTIDEAMDSIYEKLSSISTNTLFLPSDTNGLLYLYKFLPIYKEFLKSRWGVEVILQFSGDRKNRFPIEQLQLKGTRSDNKKVIDYLENTLSNLQRAEKTIVLDTTFKYKEFINYQNDLHRKQIQTYLDVEERIDPTCQDCSPLVLLDIHPTLDVRGMKFMKLPIVMKCICLTHTNHTPELNNIMDKLDTIDQDFFYTSAQYTDDLVIKKLMNKEWRSTLLYNTMLSGVLWDQNSGIYIHHVHSMFSFQRQESFNYGEDKKLMSNMQSMYWIN